MTTQSSAAQTPRRVVALVLGCAALVLALLLPAAPASASLTRFLEPSSAFPFEGGNRDAGIAVDQASHLVYVSKIGGGILKFDTSGQKVNFSALGTNQISTPGEAGHIAVDSSGDIYANNGSSKYLPSGEPDPVAPVATGWLAINSSGDTFGFRTNRDQNGNIVSSEIVEFGSDGALINHFGASVLPKRAPMDLALDSSGDLYVSEFTLYHLSPPLGPPDIGGVFEFEADGSCANSCVPIMTGDARKLAVEPGTDHLLVAIQEGVEEHQTHYKLVEYDSPAHGSAELGSFELEGAEKLRNVDSIAVDGTSGDVYVSDTGNEPTIKSRLAVFGPAVIVPTLHTHPASNLDTTSLTLNGTVNTAGAAPAQALTECSFQYVTEAAYEEQRLTTGNGFSSLASGGDAPCQPPFALIPDDGADHAVSAPITGLTPTTAYRFRLLAANQDGSNRSAPETATTAGPPLIGRQFTEALLPTSATLGATINPDELSTTYHFEYGLTASYGHATAESASIGQDLGFHEVTEAISGLVPETTYHYRVVATNSAEVLHGPDQTFTTLPPALLDPQFPALTAQTSATLQAYLDPLGVDTSYHFEWGATAAYGNTTATEDAGSGSSPTLLAAPISGLSPGITYHYRLLATNPFGTLTGPDQSFETLPAECANQELRAENASLALPDCRAYEQVSPVEKNGLPALAATLAPGGERVSFNSIGVLSGETTALLGLNTYLAERGPGGWSTLNLQPPLSFGIPVIEQATPDLGAFVDQITFTPNSGTGSSAGGLGISGADGSFAMALRTPEPPLSGGLTGPVEPLHSQGVSADGSKLVLFSTPRLLPSAPPETDNLYELGGVGGPAPQLRLLALDQGGNPIPFCHGNSPSGRGEFANISADGSRVFFSHPLFPACLSVDAELYARLDGSATVSLSNPSPNLECTSAACLAAPYGGAGLEGISADGSKAFFVSPRQLTDRSSEDPLGAEASTAPRTGGQGTCGAIGALPQYGPNGCNLYEYDFNRPAGEKILDLSATDTSGLGPQVNRVLSVSADGSHVYFVSAALLTPQPNQLGAYPQPAAANLYVADTTDTAIRFIGELCSGSEKSGSLEAVAACPGIGVDGSSLDGAQPGFGGYSLPTSTTADGRHFVFSTYAQLTPDDTNAAKDVYEYDAQTGALVRVSVGHNGQDQNGNGGGQDAYLQTQSPLRNQSAHFLSDDGSTVAFLTARPLQEGDSNGFSDVYEWRQGRVDLLSGANSSAPIEAAEVGSSGRDIVFASDQGLIPADRDGASDVYDARAGGGFPLPNGGPPICETPEGCGRTAGPEPPPPLQGSGSLEHGPEELATPCRKGFVKRHGHCVKKHVRKHHRRRHHKRAARHNRGGAK